MTPKKFIQKVVGIYQNAQISNFLHSKIKRGRSHTVSSVIEDLFSFYLISNDSFIEKIYVDQPFTYKVKNKKKTFYPDISIVKKGVITSFLDFKMDLGWNRDGLYDLCKKHNKLITFAKGYEVHFTDKKTKEAFDVPVSKQVSYNVVILSSSNINKAKLRKQLLQIKALSPHVDVFILSDNKHPRAIGSEPKLTIDDYGINRKEFKRLQRRINSSYLQK